MKNIIKANFKILRKEDVSHLEELSKVESITEDFSSGEMTSEKFITFSINNNGW